MQPPSGVSPAVGATSPLSVDIRRFPWVRPVAADYAAEYGRVADFYAGDPGSPAAWRDAISRTQRHSRPRADVSALVQSQLRRRGAPRAAIDAAGQLADPSTVAIVTGQQAGLFGGPLFTLLKAMSAIRLAEQVRVQYEVPTVALFWIDAEDHDWDEVKGCVVLDEELTCRSVTLPALDGAGRNRIADLTLDGSITLALEQLQAALPGTEFTTGVMDALRRAYQPGQTMANAFAQLLDDLLGPSGLVVYNSADPAAKPLVANLFAREVEGAGRTVQHAAQAGARLEGLGYHAQVTPQAGTLALFHRADGREPIRVTSPGHFAIGERELSGDDLVAEIRRTPDAFSPNVLLRPLVQDSLFPTACYVAGPSELAYLGQLKGVYATLEVPMPLVQPRGTATIVDMNAMRFLTRSQLPLEALRAQDEAVLNDLIAAQLPADVDAATERARHAIDERLGEVAEAARAIDATLEGAARSTAGRMQDDLRKLQAKIIQAVKRKDETLRRQFKHAQAQAFPAGQPQEREIGFVYFLARYGPALIDRLRDVMPGAPGTHIVLTI